MIARPAARSCGWNRSAGFESRGRRRRRSARNPAAPGIAAVAHHANAGHRATCRGARRGGRIPAPAKLGAGDGGLRGREAGEKAAAGTDPTAREGKGTKRRETDRGGSGRDARGSARGGGRGGVRVVRASGVPRGAQAADGRARTCVGPGDCEGGARAAIRICCYANMQIIVTSVSTPTPGDIFISQERAGRRRGHPVSHVKVKARLLHVARAYVTVLAAVSRGARCARACCGCAADGAAVDAVEDTVAPVLGRSR